jgi:hypothetical protein
VKQADRGGFQIYIYIHKNQVAILEEIQGLVVPPICPKMKKNANLRSN